MKKLTSTLVQVDWIDAQTEHGWKKKSEINDKLEPTTTVGFLVKQTTKAVVIASTVSDEYSNSQFVIPRGMIIEMREVTLRYSKKPSPEEPPPIQSPGNEHHDSRAPAV